MAAVPHGALRPRGAGCTSAPVPGGPLSDFDEQGDVDGLRAAIAAGLTDLARVAVTPAEVDQSKGFEAGASDFEDGMWARRVVEVQDWLRLDSRLDRDAEHAVLVASLARLLGADDATLVLDGVGTAHPNLNESGLELLRDRVERAINLKDRFLEDVDEGISVGAATTRWIAGWEELADDASTSGPVIAKASTWPIFEFAGRAKRGRLDLSPSYQRGDVWPLKDAQMLMESILRGIPLPSVIILKPGSEDAPFEVVDGKQRLTSILRFMGAHPTALAVVAEKDAQFPALGLADLFARDYTKFRKAWAQTGEVLTSALEKAYYFPFKLSTATDSALTGDLEWLKGQYYFAIKHHKVQVGGESVEVRDVFEAVTDYLVPVIVYTRATRQQIHDVFNLYNKQGKHLNAEEIRNAIYHDLKLMRALSVAAGDNPNLREAADFLMPIEDHVVELGTLLNAYGFGEARYRRTKVLSWLCSVLLLDPVGPDRKAHLLSTAQHINAMLNRVSKDDDDPLRRAENVRSAISLIHLAASAHSVPGTWAPKFKDNDTGKRWQELQLVASLLGVALAAAVLGPDVKDRLTEHREAILHKSDALWPRPKKTQTGEQWRFIASVALGVLEELGVARQEVTAALRREFGYSCMAGLEAALGPRQS